MTRRGTLAYYLAAWVIGCFVVSLLQWIGEALAGEIHTASILLTTYFFSLAFGAVAILLFALLLRRSMRLLGTHALWMWFLSGAILSLVEIFALIHAQSALLSIRSGEFGEIFLLRCWMQPMSWQDTIFGRRPWMERSPRSFYVWWTGRLLARMRPLSRSSHRHRIASS